MKTHLEYTHHHGTLKAYLVGFALSLLLTLAAYFVVAKQLATGHALVGWIVGLAVVQAIVQLVLFLHLGNEPKPRPHLVVFLFMALILIVIVLGSLWIMYNLDYRMMPEMPDMQHQ